MTKRNKLKLHKPRNFPSYTRHYGEFNLVYRVAARENNSLIMIEFNS